MRSRVLLKIVDLEGREIASPKFGREPPALAIEEEL